MVGIFQFGTGTASSSGSNSVLAKSVIELIKNNI